MKTVAFLGVVLLFQSASSQKCAEISSCDVNATDMADVFSKEVTSLGLIGATFLVKGIDWDVLNDSTVFDPNSWSWYLEEAGSLIDMPLDYDILSIGLLSLRMKTYDLDFSSSPPGCISALSVSCKRQIIESTILNITDRGKDTAGEMICQSVVTEKSLMTWNPVGISKKCAQRDSLKSGSGEYTTDGTWHGNNYKIRRILVFIFGTILPLFSIPLVMAWADFKPLDIGHGFVDYASNKFCKICHFRLRGASSQSTLDKRTVLMRDVELLDFEGPVTALTSIADYKLPVKMGKIKFTVMFLLQYIPVSLWLYTYQVKTETMKYLDTWEKITFNLRYNPFSWLYTNPECWPYKFAIFLIVLNVISFICLVVWWLLESTTIRKGFMNLIIKSNVYGKFRKGGHFKSRRTDVPLEKIFRNLFTAMFVTLMIGTYIVVYCIFHSAIYIIGGIVVNIEMVASWLTGVALVIYYANKSYTGVKAKYTDIKRLVFEECMLKKAYKGQILMTCDVLVNDSEHTRMIDRDRQIFSYEWVQAEGPVLLCNKDGDLMLPDRMFLRICEKLEPLKENVKKAVIDLIFTLFFLGLVVFTIAVFRPYNANSEMNVVVTSVVTLLTALIPQLAEMTNCQEQETLEKSVLVYRVKRAVNSYRPNFRTLTDTLKAFDSKATIIRHYTAEDVNAINPEVMAPLGTKVIGGTDSGNEANEFTNPSSSLPTPFHTYGGGLRPSPLPTIQSVANSPKIKPKRPDSNGSPNSPRLKRLTSNDSGMMVLDLHDFTVQDQDDSEDDIAFIDDSVSKESEKLFANSRV